MQIVMFRRSAAQIDNNLRNILRLVAYALHVRDHLQRGGDLAQVARHGLLLQQQLQAERLDGALLLVDLRVERRDLRRQLARRPRSARARPCAMTSSHSAPISISSWFSSASCSSKRLLIYPNLPVI